jgi:hypothetical protein
MSHAIRRASRKRRKKRLGTGKKGESLLHTRRGSIHRSVKEQEERERGKDNVENGVIEKGKATPGMILPKGSSSR